LVMLNAAVFITASFSNLFCPRQFPMAHFFLEELLPTLAFPGAQLCCLNRQLS
jgi:hypothetical protein